MRWKKEGVTHTGPGWPFAEEAQPTVVIAAGGETQWEFVSPHVSIWKVPQSREHFPEPCSYPSLLAPGNSRGLREGQVKVNLGV